MREHPRHQFASEDDVLRLIRAHPLGAWVCSGAQGLIANHLPFFLDRHPGPHGRLLGHVARANPVWRELGEGGDAAQALAGTASVVMFQGPQAYIMPTWYPGHTAHGRVVPTWNYAVAHVHGVARAVHDPHRLRAMLEQLTQAGEAGLAAPWRLEDAPAQYIDSLLCGIVGIEVEIQRIDARLKMSQDEDLADRHGTVAGLRASGLAQGADVAEAVQAAIDADARAAGECQAGEDRKP